MLAAKRPAGVTPEVNLRNKLHPGDKEMPERVPSWKSEQTSSKIQNMDISIQIKKKKLESLCVPKIPVFSADWQAKSFFWGGGVWKLMNSERTNSLHCLVKLGT